MMKATISWEGTADNSVYFEKKNLLHTEDAATHFPMTIKIFNISMRVPSSLKEGV